MLRCYVVAQELHGLLHYSRQLAAFQRRAKSVLSAIDEVLEQDEDLSAMYLSEGAVRPRDADDHQGTSVFPRVACYILITRPQRLRCYWRASASRWKLPSVRPTRKSPIYIKRKMSSNSSWIPAGTRFLHWTCRCAQRRQSNVVSLMFYAFSLGFYSNNGIGVWCM